MAELSIFIASPGDVEKERALALQIVDQLQLAFSGRLNIIPVFWENAPLTAAENPQEQLKRPSECDVVIGILWSRLGTPPGGGLRREDGSAYESGTVYELEDALTCAKKSGKPHILAYRKSTTTRELDLDELDEANAQRAALESFIKKWFVSDDGTPKGAIATFASLDEFDQQLTTHLTALADEFSEKASIKSAVPSQWNTSPFRGLEQYDADHAEIFFGRTKETADVAELLCERASEGIPLVLLVGRSGCGKSSLAKAGVAPYFLRRRRRVLGVDNWFYCSFRPQDADGDLTTALLKSLRASGAFDPAKSLSDEAVAGLASGPPAVLVSLMEQTLLHSRSRVFLIVDQLEEAFVGHVSSRESANSFFRLLGSLTRSGLVWCLATLRSDFYATAIDHDELNAIKHMGAQYDVHAPSRESLRTILTMSTSVAGLQLESNADEDLADILRDATVSNRSALPLLGFMMSKLFELRSGNVLTLASYRQLGELEGAISTAAESVYCALETDAVREQLPYVLKQLVKVNTGNYTRRRMQYAVIEKNMAAVELIERYVAARLFTIGGTDAGEKHVEITHEALLSNWPRARTWIEDNLDYLRAERRVSEAAKLWHGEGRNVSRLAIEGGPYNDVRLVSDQIDGELDAPVDEYIRLSIDGFRKRVSRRKLITAVLAGLAVVASGASFVALHSKFEAEFERTAAEATSDFVVELFQNADPNFAYSGDVPARVALDVGKETVVSLADNPEIQARLIGPMARAYTGLGDSRTAIALLENTINAEDLRGVSASNRFGISFALGEAYLYESAFADAKRNLKQAEIYLSASGSANLSRQSEIFVALADVEAFDEVGGDLTLARSLYEQALAIDTLIGDRLAIARDKNRLGYVSYYENNLDHARAEFSDALDVAEQELKRSDHLLIARYQNDVAATLYEDGMLVETRPLYEFVINVYDRVFAADNLEAAIAKANLGRVLIEIGLEEEARFYLQAAYDAQETRLPQTATNISITLNNLALVNRASGDILTAKAQLLESLEHAGNGSLSIRIQTHTHLAEIYMIEGDIAKARNAIEEAKDIAATIYGDPADFTDWRYAIFASAAGEFAIRQCDKEAATSLLADSSRLMNARWSTDNVFTSNHAMRTTLLQNSAAQEDWCADRLN